MAFPATPHGPFDDDDALPPRQHHPRSLVDIGRAMRTIVCEGDVWGDGIIEVDGFVYWVTAVNLAEREPDEDCN